MNRDNLKDADYFFGELYDLLECSQRTLRWRYAELGRIYMELLMDRTCGSGMDFSGPFARLTHLMQTCQIDVGQMHRVNAFRGRSRSTSPQDEEILRQWLLVDIRTIADLVAGIFHVSLPLSLSSRLPLPVEKQGGGGSLSLSVLRVSVLRWDDWYIYAVPCHEGCPDVVRIPLALQNNSGDWSYMRSLLSPNVQLNLVRPRLTDDLCQPELIILQPDYLMDISGIASLFESYGASPYTSLLHRLQPQETSSAMLLGNLAGQMLDEEINAPEGCEKPYAESARAFFLHNALTLAACPELGTFHDEAKAQQQNIRKILQTALCEDRRMDFGQVVLEPSFFCEMLGVQGRMDLLQLDYRLLMEQKSGKREYGTGRHQEKHYVQMLLYLAILHYAMGQRNEDVSCYLLYSRFSDGLMKEGPAPRLLHEAIRLRNQSVWIDFALSRGCGRDILEALTPEKLNVKGSRGALWDRFVRPRLAHLLDTLHGSTEVEKAYFYRFLTFVQREHLLAKIGNEQKEASGFASIWSHSLEEKRQAGNILNDLRILSLCEEEKGEGIRIVTLQMPQDDEEDYLPNFRLGDFVVLYPYTYGEQPDARRTIVMRAGLQEMQEGRVVLRLRSAQHNERVFPQHENTRWALEHDFMESSFTGLYRSLYSLLLATPSRRALLLGQRPALRDEKVTLVGSYSSGTGLAEHDQIVLRARQAQDYFILIGPPGTGKTSFGMVNILRETLLHPEESVLLLSYTNRAVDEMCSKLVQHGIDFIRVGSLLNCPESYRPYLLEERARTCTHVDAVRHLLCSARVVVGTTASITSHQLIFRIRSFSMAIVDEASQILEPHLLAILCATYQSRDAVGRFVFIGDHKQLPAVVQQTAQDAEVHEPVLHDIGLTSCSNSLFQRLLWLQQRQYPQGESPLVHHLTRQGRMHEQVAQFASKAFYSGKLVPIPLAHQRAELLFPHHAPYGLENRLAHQRVLFLPVERPEHSTSDKANVPEAELVAKVVLAVWNLYTQNGRDFSPEQSVGIIVPYRNQIAVIRRQLERMGIPDRQRITIDTVERFQGSERDVIVYCFTVQRPYQLDFLTSHTFEEDGVDIDRKLNVALTRAREQMVLIGNEHLLSTNPIFARLIAHASVTPH